MTVTLITETIFQRQKSAAATITKFITVSTETESFMERLHLVCPKTEKLPRTLLIE
jgi:hypothetical protein